MVRIDGRDGLPMVLGIKHTHCNPGGMLTRSVIHRLPVCIPIGLVWFRSVRVWIRDWIRDWVSFGEICSHVY